MVLEEPRFGRNAAHIARDRFDDDRRDLATARREELLRARRGRCKASVAVCSTIEGGTPASPGSRRWRLRYPP